MISTYTRFFSLLLSASLSFTVLPTISNEDNFIVHEADFSYIHLDEQFSPMVKVLCEIGKLDEDANSPIHTFSRYISQECTCAEYDYVVQLLEYAEDVLHSHYKKLNPQHAQCLMAELQDVINQVFEIRTVVRKTDNFDDVKIKKSLSVADLYVANCVKNLCINKLSSVDAAIQNLTVTGTSSIPLNNVSIAQATIATLSVSDEVINDTLRFTDTVGGEYVGLKAPGIVPSSYTLLLPAIAPEVRQILRTNFATSTTMEWATAGTAIDPTVTKMIYIAKRGSDSTGNGSFDFPYATLAKAVTIANEIASAVNPITITLTPGIYVENNTIEPITVTAAGISIIGDSASGVIIAPSTPTKDLLLANNTIRMSNLTLQSTAPFATGISLTAGKLTVFDSVRIINFLVGINCSGTPVDAYGFVSCFFVNNGTALVNNNAAVELNSCTIFGVGSLAIPAANTGVTMTGSNARVVFDGGVCGLCGTGFNINDNSSCTINSVAFRRNTYDIVQNGASHLVLSACNFELTNGSTEIDIQVSGAGTTTEIVGCEFNGDATSGVPQGIGLLVSDNALVGINSSSIRNYDTAIVIGFTTDTSSTMLTASGIVIRDCATDILQKGSASLSFSSSIADSSKIVVNDATNVNLAFFDSANNGVLSIGSFVDRDTTLIQAEISHTNHPKIDYKSSLYSSPAMGFESSVASPASWFVSSADKSNLSGITTDRTKSCSLQLISDTANPLGSTAALRGWSIDKKGSSAQLSFDYQNTDIVDQITVPQHTVMQLDGVNNQLQLPTVNTQIVFAGDTNLYRSGAHVLQTDANFVVDTLNPGCVVVTDEITNQLASSTITKTEIGYLAGVMSPIQTQLNAINTAITLDLARTPEQYTISADNQTYNVASTTTVLLLSTNEDIMNFTIVFPVLPANGQLFTILTDSPYSIGITNDGNINNGNPAPVVNGITRLDVNIIPTASEGGVGVTYIYLTATNSWYRYSRG